MKTTGRFLRLCAAMVAIFQTVPARAAEPVVSNLSAAQRAGTKLVDIGYNVTAETATVKIKLEVSSNGGATFDVPVSAVSGNVGNGVAVGNGKVITWDAGADWNGQYSAQTRFRVTADDGGTPQGFSLIPAGSFTMGDASYDGLTDAPLHNVYVSGFYMQQKEVTKAQWDAVANWASSHGYNISAASGGGIYQDHPVFWVNWYQVVKWCNARSEMEGLTPCYTVSGATYKTGNFAPDCNWTANGHRLPTEAEWEKAARGGLSGKRYPWGDSIDHSYATFQYNGGGYNPAFPGYPPYPGASTAPEALFYTAPVGSFAPNGYGLYDMAGNMWEWCWDWYDSNYYNSSPGSDPRGPADGTYRVDRGGSWGNDPRFCRVASREYPHSPTNAYNGGGYGIIGFRTVRSLVP